MKIYLISGVPLPFRACNSPLSFFASSENISPILKQKTYLLKDKAHKAQSDKEFTDMLASKLVKL